ncbi:MAG: hypothetical protein ACREWJ_09110 [Rhodoferax sp.]
MTGATLEPIARNLKAVRARMAVAAVRASHDPAAIRLLAVSKTWPAAAIEAACKTGHTYHGENYLQEALPKLEALRDRRELVWHFIGALQAPTRPGRWPSVLPGCTRWTGNGLRNAP